MRENCSADPAAGDLHRECGELAWSELLPHFARGAVIHIVPGMDLIDVARAFRDDDAHQVGGWLRNGWIGRASDDDARRWNQHAPAFRAIVVAPWVLAQELAITH